MPEDVGMPAAPEVVAYRPQGCGIEKLPDGTTSFQFPLSPLKVVCILMPQEGVDALKAALNSGIVTASAIEVPS